MFVIDCLGLLLVFSAFVLVVCCVLCTRVSVASFAGGMPLDISRDCLMTSLGSVHSGRSVCLCVGTLSDHSMTSDHSVWLAQQFCVLACFLESHTVCLGQQLGLACCCVEHACDSLETN